MSDNWKITGQYFESCNCDLVCPCIFLEPPTEGFCEAQVGWTIDEGNLDGVDLSGRKVAAWLHAPCKGETGNLTDGGWSLALYVDDGATDEQFNAICELWSGNHGGHLAVIASLGVIIGAAYMLWLYKRVVFGKLVNLELKEMVDLNKSELFILTCLAIPTLFFGFYPDPLINTIEVSVSDLITFYNFNVVNN